MPLYLQVYMCFEVYVLLLLHPSLNALLDLSMLTIRQKRED